MTPLLLLLLLLLLPPRTLSDNSKDEFHGSPPFQRERVTTYPFSPSPSLRFGASISAYVEDEYGFYGQHLVNAWEMFIDWVNVVKGGINVNGTNYSVSLALIDDFMDPVLAEKGMEYLVEEKSSLEGLDFMFAPYSSGLTRVAEAVASRENLILGSSGAAVSNPTSNNTFYTLLPDAENVMSYFQVFATAGVETISIMREAELSRCELDIVTAASLATNITVVSYDVYNHTLGATEFVDYLNGLTSDTLLVCSRQHLCEGVTIALNSDRVQYLPKGLAMSPCSSVFHPEYTITSVPWSHELDFHCNYTGWTPRMFYDKYLYKFQLIPSYHAASTFATGLTLMAAIEATQSFDTDVVFNEILQGYYQTVYGNCSFGNPNRQCDFRPVVLQKLIDPFSGNLTDLDSVLHILDYEDIVFPPDLASSSIIYPAPTLLERACHDVCVEGTCDSLGVCSCLESFYGEDCSRHCDGDVVDGECLDVRTIYVGGLIIDATQQEYIAMMNLAVELVNNKTDGFFDETPRVHFEFNLNTTNCDVGHARATLRGQEDWARSLGGELGGLIGPMCSYVCLSVADYGKTVELPQVGFYAASSELSDPDKYAFFSRTYPSSVNQANLLTNMMEELGLLQFLFVVHEDDYLGHIYYNDFSDEWTRRDHVIIGSHAVNTNDAGSDDISNILSAILESGSPIVLMCVPFEIALAVVSLASKSEDFDTSAILWVFSDFFITYNIDTKKEHLRIPDVNGALTLFPHHAENDLMTMFLEYWASLDPVEYPDTDGDRTTVSMFSPYIVDSIFALSKAYQITLDEFNYEDGSIFRERAFFNLVNGVEFNGLSGSKSFNSFGDLREPIFNVLYTGLNTSVHIGNVNRTAVNVNTSLFQWPDGSQGATSSYSLQLSPRCKPGYEPQSYTDPDTGIEMKACGPCAVGYFKSQSGSDPCTPCTEGMDVGLIVPCLLPGYWRPPDEAITELTYSVFRCDVHENCLGGCTFNESCREGVDQSSPTCGVCANGYAVLGTQECTSCETEEEYLLFFFVSVCVMAVGCIFLFLWFSVKDEEGHSNSSVDVLSLPRTARHDTISRDTISRDTIGDRLSRPIRIMSRRTVLEVKKKIDIQAFTTNSITSFKLVLSFYLIMTEVVFELDVNWPHRLNFLFSSLTIGQPLYLSAYFCSGNNAQVYYDMMLFYFLFPMAFTLAMAMMGAAVIWFRIKRYSKINNKPMKWVKRNVERLRSNVNRMCLLFFLIIFPIVTSEYLLFFDCRDFGEHGSYLREDYSVECYTKRYESRVPLALAGIFLYGLGIPIVFYYVVRKRDIPIFAKASIVLHRSFKEKYKQFEIVALLHKVMLFSVVFFVAQPGTSSQCLFLLLCNLAYFSIVALLQPYAFRTDTILALTFTGIESFAFLVAFLVISGVADVEGYNLNSIFDALFIFLITALFVLMPTLYAFKYEKVNSFFQRKTGIAINKAKAIARRSHRSSSNAINMFRRRSSADSDKRNLREVSLEDSNISNVKTFKMNLEMT